MHNTILLITILGSALFVILGLLCFAGYLIRRDLDRMRAGGFSDARLTRDPLTLKDTLVQFFAHSKGSSRIIRLLAARRKPLGYRALADEIRFDEHWRRDSDPLPAGAIFAQLAIMQVAGLARCSRHGFSITAVGRHVQRHIDPGPLTLLPRIRAQDSPSGSGIRTAAALSSADRARPQAPRKRSAHSSTWE